MVAEKALELLKDPFVVAMLGGVLCWGFVCVAFTAPVGKETGDGH